MVKIPPNFLASKNKEQRHRNKIDWHFSFFFITLYKEFEISRDKFVNLTRQWGFMTQEGHKNYNYRCLIQILLREHFY